MFLLAALLPTKATADPSELGGDPAAIAQAEAMVEAMGGLEIWRELESVHLVHEWQHWSRPDTYIENEILDLGAPRSYVTMRIEIYERMRAYSPEHCYWNIENGEFSYASEQSFADAMERAPYSLYRIGRAVARGDSRYDVRFGPMKDIPTEVALEFRGPDDLIHGWILLDTHKEPVIWATTGGRVRYQMISLTGSNRPADPLLFAPPPEHSERGRKCVP
jgi:hypothetical protein